MACDSLVLVKRNRMDSAYLVEETKEKDEKKKITCSSEFFMLSRVFCVYGQNANDIYYSI